MLGSMCTGEVSADVTYRGTDVFSPTESAPDPAHTEPNTFLYSARRTTTTKGPVSFILTLNVGPFWVFFIFFFCRQWRKILWPWCLMWVPFLSSAGFHVGKCLIKAISCTKQEQGHRQRDKEKWLKPTPLDCRFSYTGVCPLEYDL